MAEPFSAKLVPLKENALPDKPFTVAVVFNFESGWHSYWRNPGEAGEETRITFELPEGFKAGEINWPVPERFETAGFKEFGYTGKAYHFAQIIPPENYADSVIPIKAKVSLLLCGKECLPKEEELYLSLPVKDGETESLNPELAEVYASLPIPYAGGVTFEDKGEVLELSFPEELSKDADFFPYQNEIVPEEKAHINGNVLTLAKYESSFSPAEVGGVLRMDGKSYEVLAKPFVVKEGRFALLTALLLAFVGGLILNFMPCVLPLLSLKILGIVRAEKEKVRRNSVAYAAGVIASFLIIAGIITILKSVGTSLGWGFQMQNPQFVFFLIGLMMLLGLMLSGFLEAGASLVRFGAGRQGAFASGVLAVLLASPCVAPFMGTAMAYALTAAPETVFLVFGVMGFGLAFPFLLLSLHTGWVKYMPKSGLWSKRLQEFLALPLYATSVWLAWVLEKQMGAVGIYWALGLQTAIIAAVFMKRKYVALGAVIVFIAGLLFLTEGKAGKPDLQGKYVEWQQYSEQNLQAVRDEGKPVFLKFSAAWCLTCLVNEKLVLDTLETKELFERKNIVPMAADWSAKDAEVTKALNSYGYNGVPLYVYYPEGKNSAFRVLPQLLTGAMLLKAFDEE